MMKVVVVIPAFNEEKNIINVVKKTHDALGKDNKIILVDNGSTDNTVNLARKNFPKLEIITENKRGKGNAIRKGFEIALQYNPDFVVMTDGDGEKNPYDIPKLVDFAELTNSDLVIGRRSRMRSLRREILRKFENWWINLATGYGLNDASSGFNAIKAKSLERLNLKSSGFEIEPELILECRRKMMKVVEVPVDTSCICPTKVKKGHMVSVNRFFDEWILQWIKSNECDMSLHKKIFLRAFCTLGLVIFRQNRFTSRN